VGTVQAGDDHVLVIAAGSPSKAADRYHPVRYSGARPHGRRAADQELGPTEPSGLRTNKSRPPARGHHRKPGNPGRAARGTACSAKPTGFCGNEAGTFLVEGDVVVGVELPDGNRDPGRHIGLVRGLVPYGFVAVGLGR